MKSLHVIAIILILTVSAGCSTPPQPKPQAFQDAELLLKNGTQAYYNDEYRPALQHFTQALQLYQSVDDQTGIINALVNLIETQMALGQWAQAQKSIDALNHQLTLSADAVQQKRAHWLQARLEYNKGNGAQAIKLLLNIAPAFDQQQKIRQADAQSLPIVSSLARYTQQLKHKEASLWLMRFEQLLTADDNASYHALLLRLKVRSMIDQGEFERARSILDQSLELDRQQAYRRGLAEALALKAELEYSAGQLELADQLYQRALTIQFWIMDKHAARHTLNQLILINQQLDRPGRIEAHQSQLDKL